MWIATRGSGFFNLKRCFCNLSRSIQTVNISESNKWEAVIGLEIHAQIDANSKLFSGANTVFGTPINNGVSFFDAALPGTLPVLNKECVIAAVKTALSLNCSVNKVSYFDRKHYFYADLPAGFQITQQRKPLAIKGHLHYLVPDCSTKKMVKKVARLIQIQLEQDSGKSLHNVYDRKSLIDLNRAGIGLMEIITEPDFRSSEEVTSFVKELQLLLQTIDVCDAKMEEGSMRVDASVSVRKPQEPLGIRTEVKNLNSIRSIGRAVDYEISRQINSLENGIEIQNETMFYDVENDCTIVLRDKERVHDYRFMPEPNLPPLLIEENLETIMKDLPTLPDKRRTQLVQEDGLSLEQSIVLVSIPPLLNLFDKFKTQLSNKKLNKSVANFCMNEILAAVNKFNISLHKSNLLSDVILQILSMLFVEKRINLSVARKILDATLDPKQEVKDVEKYVQEGGMEQLSDDDVLREICLNVCNKNPEAVENYKSGKKKVLNFLIGQVQKEVGGRGNGQKIVDIFDELIHK